MKAAREDWRRRQPGSTATPALIMGETAHPAFAKAATYLGLEIIRLPVDPGKRQGAASRRGRRAGRRC